MQALNDGKTDLKEFQVLQRAYYNALEKLSSTDRKMTVELQSIKNTLNENAS